MEEAERLLKLPTYVFAQLDKLKAESRAQGMDLIDLGMGNPDVSPPQAVQEALVNAIKNPENHRYPSFEGNPEFREAVSEWCQRQYQIEVDPVDEVLTLIGSKEGLVHLAFAYINPGDTTLVPLPAYPAHFRGTILAGGEPYVLPTTEKTGFIPDLKAIDKSIAKRAKILFLNYPTNPTAAFATKEFLEEAISFCKENDLILVHDFAYAEVYFEGQKPVSALSIEGAKDVTIEFHSLSKSFGMAGWRIGFVVGNKEVISTLQRIKTNLDYGLFKAVQEAAIAALKMENGYLDEMRAIYQERRDLMIKGLNELGWKIKKTKGTMYLFIPVPEGYNSTDFSIHLLKETGVVVAPGVAFGELGEGYVRIALVAPKERLSEAIERIKKSSIRYNQ